MLWGLRWSGLRRGILTMRLRWMRTICGRPMRRSLPSRGSLVESGEMRVAGFRIRVAEAADLRGVVALERATREAPHWAEAEYAAIVNADGDVDSWVRRCLLVAETEGRLLGFAVGKAIGSGAGSVAELESVAVEAAARREGVGRALCEAVVVWCREQGAAAMESGAGGSGWERGGDCAVCRIGVYCCRAARVVLQGTRRGCSADAVGVRREQVRAE